MARLPENLPTHVLPLWDTFEVGFFLCAGIFLGIVLGILFPSLWRTLRRRFRRPHSRGYLDTSSLLLFEVASKLELPPEETLSSSVSLNAGAKDLQNERIHSSLLKETFFTARYLLSQNQLREAIQLYTQILGSPYVSKHQTHAALFELSQCYSQLNLFTKAFEISSELSARLRNQAKVFAFAVQNACADGNTKGLLLLLDRYSGQRSSELRTEISSQISALVRAENKFSRSLTQDLKIQLLNRALRWNEGNLEARIVLWSLLSQGTWDLSPSDPRTLCRLIFEDFFSFCALCKEYELSSFSVAKSISMRLLKLANSSPDRSHFAQAKSDFLENNQKELLEFFPTQAHGFREQSQFFFAAFCKLPLGVAQPQSLALQLAGEELLSEEHNAKFRNLFLTDAEHSPNQLPESSHRCSSCKGIFEDFFWHCPGCKTQLSLQYFNLKDCS
jgi:hypothetical protein